MGIYSMFTRKEAKQVAQVTAQAGGRVHTGGNLLQCYCLAWEFEMDLHLLVKKLAFFRGDRVHFTMTLMMTLKEARQALADNSP